LHLREAVSRPARLCFDRAVRLETLEQRGKLSLERFEPARLGQLGRSMSRDHNVVVIAGDPIGERPEGLAKQALHVIALDRSSNAPADRDAKAHSVRRIIPTPLTRKRVEHEVPACGRVSLAVDPLEVGAAREARASPGCCSRTFHRQMVRPAI
jgi:hypothetical protein